MKKEQFIVVCRRHWTRFFIPTLITIFFVILAFTSISFGDTTYTIGLFFVAFILLLYILIASKSDYIALTESKIVMHSGFFSTRVKSTPITKVQNIEIRSGLFGKLFRYHTVIVDNAGTGNKEFCFKNAAHAEEFVEAVQARM